MTMTKALLQELFLPLLSFLSNIQSSFYDERVFNIEVVDAAIGALDVLCTTFKYCQADVVTHAAMRLLEETDPQLATVALRLLCTLSRTNQPVSW